MVEGGDQVSEDSFEALYQVYFQDVYRFLLSLCHDPHLAEELTADTFLKALANLDTFRSDSSMSTWLCQIGKNTYYSLLRKKKPTHSLSALPPMGDPLATPMEEVLIDKEQADTLYSLVHQLSDPYKEVFLLRVFADLSFKEIGRLFHKTENWACVTYHRGKKKVQQSLQASEGESHENKPFL
ncbi:MAG: RNA polymerase sigma factor [Clostridiales bacterium]|nr:RNA polymerase sigma factor [Clostridiales bacterium]